MNLQGMISYIIWNIILFTIHKAHKDKAEYLDTSISIITFKKFQLTKSLTLLREYVRVLCSLHTVLAIAESDNHWGCRNKVGGFILNLMLLSFALY